jgi:hypothetical protein
MSTAPAHPSVPKGRFFALGLSNGCRDDGRGAGVRRGSVFAGAPASAFDDRAGAVEAEAVNAGVGADDADGTTETAGGWFSGTMITPGSCSGGSGARAGSGGGRCRTFTVTPPTVSSV